MPELQPAAPVEKRQEERAGPGAEVVEEQHRAPAPAVGEGAGERRQERVRQAGEEGDQRQGGDRSRLPIGPHSESEGGEARAQVGDDLAGPDEDEVAHAAGPLGRPAGVAHPAPRCRRSSSSTARRASSSSSESSSTSSTRRETRSAAAGSAAGESAAASPAIVGSAKKRAIDSSALKVLRNREVIWVAISECPPSSKKLSWTPSPSIPRSSSQMPAIVCSVSLAGAT